MINHYFNQYSAAAINEQRLMEDLINESINIMGHSCWYIPRDTFDGNFDFLFGETQNTKFDRAYLIPLYLANVEGYEGDGDFFSKFGLDIRDTSNFVVSSRSFKKYVPSSIAIRPREGDLVYIPVMRKIFEIKFVEEELMFFSLGKRDPYIYELRCELFRYNNENLTTGVEEVDIIEDRVAYAQLFDLGNGSGAYQRGEIIYQGNSYATANVTGEVKNWDPTTKKLEVINLKGVFASTVSIKGLTSNATYVLTTSETYGDNVEYDIYDNKNLQQEGNTFIDLSESNPFGYP